MKIWNRGKAVASRLSAYNVAVYSANASFFLILSLFPSIVLLLSLLPYIGFTRANLTEALSGVLPSILEPILFFMIEDLATSSSFVVLSVSAVIALWTSSRAVFSMQIGLNGICDAVESRSYIIQRLLCMLYTLMLIIALVLTLLIHAFGAQLSVFLLQFENYFAQLASHILQYKAWIMFLLLTFFFAFLYWILPNRKIAFYKVLPGAMLASFSWQIFSKAFSFYTMKLADYSKYYGSFASAAIAFVWIYFCMYILFYGQVFNELLPIILRKIKIRSKIRKIKRDSHPK